MDTTRTYTLDDLANWSRIHSGVSLAVLGYPINHSISPAMHNAALAKMAEGDPQYSNWKYFRFEVPPEKLTEDALASFLKAGFKGLNLTVPHKIIAYDLVNTVGHVKEIGAVNTLVADDDVWFGYNTDGYGLSEGLRDDLKVELAGAQIILLGAGGAARGAAVECLHRGCASLWIGNRTQTKLHALLTLLEPIKGNVMVLGFDSTRPRRDLPHKAVIINATSLGLTIDAFPIDFDSVHAPRAVYDMVYGRVATPLLVAAKLRKIPAADGLSMLVHQGARALEIWTGRAVPVDAMRTAARAAMGR